MIYILKFKILIIFLIFILMLLCVSSKRQFYTSITLLFFHIIIKVYIEIKLFSLASRRFLTSDWVLMQLICFLSLRKPVQHIPSVSNLFKDKLEFLNKNHTVKPLINVKCQDVTSIKILLKLIKNVNLLQLTKKLCLSEILGFCKIL